MFGDFMRGLYLHIPFCRKICKYCDFYKMVASDEFKDRFIDYLIKDLKLTIKKFQILDFSTIYIGGGTPSCLSNHTLIKLLSSISQLIDISKVVEYTIEVNPEDITPEKCAIFKRFGINRISIGIQSFDSKNTPFLGRKSEFDIVQQKLNLLIENGITNYSFDLIYAIPYQTLEMLEKDLDLMILLNPKHISTYSLQIEEKTILKHQIEKNNYLVVDEEKDLQMYQLIKTKLLTSFYNHYETSNFAIEGFESKHNQIYWNLDEYLGIGPSSASFYNQKRFTKVCKLKTYYEMLEQDKLPVLEIEELDTRRMMEDYIMLGLRKCNGINLVEFEKRFDQSLFEVFPKVLDLIDDESLVLADNQLKINEKFEYIANYIIGKIIFET